MENTTNMPIIVGPTDPHPFIIESFFITPFFAFVFLFFILWAFFGVIQLGFDKDRGKKKIKFGLIGTLVIFLLVIIINFIGGILGVGGLYNFVLP